MEDDEDEYGDDILADMPGLTNYDKTRVRADSTKLNELDIDGVIKNQFKRGVIKRTDFTPPSPNMEKKRSYPSKKSKSKNSKISEASSYSSVQGDSDEEDAAAREVKSPFRRRGRLESVVEEEEEKYDDK